MNNILSKISDLKKSISQKHPRFVDSYALEESNLGRGSFATVQCCKRVGQADGETLAVKVFDRKRQRGLRREFRNESKLLQMIPAHQHCVQMLDAFEGPRFCHIVMEKCGSSVQVAFLKYVDHTEIITEQDLAHVFKCMLLGVQHLHDCGVVHRDIKPANLLLAHGNCLLNRPVVKVCDLGLATRLPARGGIKETCGTAPYMAPEMLLKKSAYHSEVDLWSCGVTAYLMLLGDFPYTCPKGGDADLMKEAIRSGTVMPKFKAHKSFAQPSKEAIRFLQSLLKRDPELRVTCARALASEYIRSTTQPTLTSSPSFGPQQSFGPTLSIALSHTQAEPPAETPNLKDIPGDDDDDESTTCGSSEEDLAPCVAARPIIIDRV